MKTSPSGLTADTILMTSPHARWSRQDDGSLEVETPDAILNYGAADAPLIDAALCRGKSPQRAAELVDKAEFWSKGIALIEPALEEGAFRDVTGVVMGVTSAVQLKAYYALCDEWARDIFVGPFWGLVLNGGASTKLMLGWCEQFYHRTVGADEHNALAVANCGIDAVVDDLTAHFSQEAGHGEIFLKGLEAAGVPRTSVLARPPLPSTQALLRFFNDLAQSDTLGYLACYGVLHSPREGQTLDAVRRQFDALARAYPEAAPAIRRVGEHAEIDVRADHDQIVLEPYLLSRPRLTRHEAVRVLSAVRGTVAVFIDFFDGILRAQHIH